MPIGQAAQSLNLAKDRGLGARDNLLALVGGDRTERTASETAAVHTNGPFDHVVSRYPFVLVFGVRRVLVRQVVDSVELLGGKRWIRRIDDHKTVSNRLYQRLLVDFVGFDFYESEVLRVLTFVL